MASVYEAEKRRAVKLKVSRKKELMKKKSENQQNRKQKNNEKSKEVTIGLMRRAIKSLNL